MADGKEELSVNLGVVSLRTPIEARHRTQDSPYDADALLVDAITSQPGAPRRRVRRRRRKARRDDRQDPGEHKHQHANQLRDSGRPVVRLRPRADRPTSRSTRPDAPDTAPAGQKTSLGIRPFLLSGKRSPAYVDSVQPGSPAARAGLKKDDLIMAIGGETVKDIREYERVAAQLRPGVEVTFLVKRKQDILELKVTPDAERPK